MPAMLTGIGFAINSRMKWSWVAFAALLPWGAVAKEKLQYWREVRLGRADVLAALGDCNADDAHLRACLAAAIRSSPVALPAY